MNANSIPEVDFNQLAGLEMTDVVQVHFLPGSIEAVHRLIRLIDQGIVTPNNARLLSNVVSAGSWHGYNAFVELRISDPAGLRPEDFQSALEGSIDRLDIKEIRRVNLSALDRPGVVYLRFKPDGVIAVQELLDLDAIGTVTLAQTGTLEAAVRDRRWTEDRTVKLLTHQVAPNDGARDIFIKNIVPHLEYLRIHPPT